MSVKDHAARINRGRLGEFEDELDVAVFTSTPGATAMLCETVVVTSYPLVAASYYAVRELTPGGPEVEGGSGTFAQGTRRRYALNIGSRIPPPGTKLIAEGTGGRWTFRYDGGT